MLLGVYGGLNASRVYGGINAQKCIMAAMLFKNIYMYFSKVYFPKVYPTCVSSKLCEFIYFLSFLKGEFCKIVYTFIRPVWHNIWWDNRWNGSLGPKSGVKFNNSSKFNYIYVCFYTDGSMTCSAKSWRREQWASFFQILASALSCLSASGRWTCHSSTRTTVAAVENATLYCRRIP